MLPWAREVPCSSERLPTEPTTAILYCTTLHYTNYTTLHYTILQYTTLYYTTLYHTTILHYTTILYYSIYYTILYYTLLYFILYTLYSIVYILYSTLYILYSILYTLLYHSIQKNFKAYSRSRTIPYYCSTVLYYTVWDYSIWWCAGLLWALDVVSSMFQGFKGILGSGLLLGDSAMSKPKQARALARGVAFRGPLVLQSSSNCHRMSQGFRCLGVQ